MKSLFTIPVHTGIAEGIAYRARTAEFFIADVHQRCVWQRRGDGAVCRFTSTDDRVLGVFDIEIDETRGRLWAATAMMEAVTGCTAANRGQAAFIGFDLATGEIAEAFPLPKGGAPHLLGDLILGGDGTLYATDSAAPIVWRLVSNAPAPEVLVNSPEFRSLQGIALLDGGRKLVVSDYAEGLIVIDLGTRTTRQLANPPGTMLAGLDGLVARGSQIVAVQNGLEPQRVLRISLSDDLGAITEVTTLAASLPGFTDLTLATPADDRPVVVAQSGWALFDPKNPAAIPAHEVQVFQLPNL